MNSDLEFLTREELKEECCALRIQLAQAGEQTSDILKDLQDIITEFNKVTAAEAELGAFLAERDRIIAELRDALQLATLRSLDGIRLANVRRIMVEKLWFPRFIGSIDGKQRWTVYSWMALSSLKDTTAVWMTGDDQHEELFTAEDPIEALEKCYAWWIKNYPAHPAPEATP